MQMRLLSDLTEKELDIVGIAALVYPPPSLLNLL